jgi:hypothetical protein
VGIRIHLRQLLLYNKQKAHHGGAVEEAFIGEDSETFNQTFKKLAREMQVKAGLDLAVFTKGVRAPAVVQVHA